jgi:hypothetical protein
VSCKASGRRAPVGGVCPGAGNRRGRARRRSAVLRLELPGTALGTGPARPHPRRTLRRATAKPERRRPGLRLRPGAPRQHVPRRPPPPHRVPQGRARSRPAGRGREVPRCRPLLTPPAARTPAGQGPGPPPSRRVTPGRARRLRAEPGGGRRGARGGSPLRLPHLPRVGRGARAAAPGLGEPVHRAERQAGERRRRLDPPAAPRPLGADARHPPWIALHKGELDAVERAMAHRCPGRFCPDRRGSGPRPSAWAATRLRARLVRCNADDVSGGGPVPHRWGLQFNPKSRYLEKTIQPEGTR